MKIQIRYNPEILGVCRADACFAAARCAEHLSIHYPHAVIAIESHDGCGIMVECEEPGGERPEDDDVTDALDLAIMSVKALRMVG